MRLKQRDVEAAVKFLFPKSEFAGKGVYKLAYFVGKEWVIKVNRRKDAGKLERRAFDNLPDDLKAYTLFLSSRVQLQERVSKVGKCPVSTLKQIQEVGKEFGVINITKGNVGYVKLTHTWKVIDCFPVGWGKEL